MFDLEALCVPISPEHIREFQRRKAKFRAVGGLCLVVSACGFLVAAGIGTVDSNSSGAAWSAMIISAIVGLGGAVGFFVAADRVLRCPNCGRPPTHSENVLHKATWCIHCSTRLA